MHFNGIYHLFYQYNPIGAVWGNIVWAHSISKDLINWKKLEPAIAPSIPSDIYGCWSGSATVLPGNKPIILYTGIIDMNQTQVQNYAIPANLSDPYLTKWIKPDNNPLITADIGVNKTAFRDPTTAWKGPDGRWRILIGGRRRQRGVSLLYRSKDFMKWTKAQHPLHTKAHTGNWECPDFFPVSKKGGKLGLDTSANGDDVIHVLKNSLDATRYDYYTLGTYFHDKDRYVPDNTSDDGWKGLRYDYGNFYASKSFFDESKNRRILWGWANESDTPIDDVSKGWSGIQAIPRTLWLDSNGKQLLQWPIEELNTLRGSKVKLNGQTLNKGDHIEVNGITAAQADVEVTFSFSSLDKAEPFDPSWDMHDAQKLCSQKGSTVEGGLGPFGLLTLASEKLEEYTPVFFRIFKAQDNKHVILMCSDASSSSLRTGSLYKPSFAGFMDVDLADKKLSLRSLIDHSVVESFGEGGKTCILSRVYPTMAIKQDAHLYAFNNGTEIVTIDSLDAWSMNTPKINYD
ncbi:hypothetical protein LIER_33114 [Lithospermum erythrorhizon]|uniref:Beta-fructofuranosidase n=1 Tax=Lithospermum erythrorhizon TaxID=34254 RepID=A0AAV3RVQ5_LITER